MTRPRHDPRAELGDEVPYVELKDAQEHGYWGRTPDTSDDSQYTVTGTEDGYESAGKAKATHSGAVAAKKATEKPTEKHQ